MVKCVNKYVYALPVLVHYIISQSAEIHKYKLKIHENNNFEVKIKMPASCIPYIRLFYFRALTNNYGAEVSDNIHSTWVMSCPL